MLENCLVLFGPLFFVLLMSCSSELSREELTILPCVCFCSAEAGFWLSWRRFAAWLFSWHNTSLQTSGNVYYLEHCWKSMGTGWQYCDLQEITFFFKFQKKIYIYIWSSSTISGSQVPQLLEFPKCWGVGGEVCYVSDIILEST